MHAATLTAVVVFPTPPFWLAIAYTVPIVRGTLAGDPVGSASFVCERTVTSSLRVDVCGPFPPGGGTDPGSSSPSGTRAESGRRPPLGARSGGPPPPRDR